MNIGVAIVAMVGAFFALYVLMGIKSETIK